MAKAFDADERGRGPEAPGGAGNLIFLSRSYERHYPCSGRRRVFFVLLILGPFAYIGYRLGRAEPLERSPEDH